MAIISDPVNGPENASKPDLGNIDNYVHWAKDILRYGDTDRQGHVNNAVFVTFFESGRVAILYNSNKPLAPTGSAFVIARLVLDYRAEILWPNEVAIGTMVTRLGNSSVAFGQGLFVNDKCVAVAETVVVLIDEATRKSRALPEQTRAELMAWFCK